METNRQDCNAHYIAHNQAITEAQKRLEKLEETIEGMPQEIKFIKENLNRVCTSMDKLLDRLDTKFVTKESFDVALVGMSKHVDDVKHDADKDIKELKEQNKWLIRGLIVTALALLKDFLPFLHK